MSAFAPISLDDGVSPTPNTHTFSPSSIDPAGVARYFENDVATVLDGRNAISIGVKLPKAGGQVARVTMKVVIPVMNDDTPPLKIGEVIGNVEFVLPKNSTIDQRADVLAYTANYLADASVVAAVTELESVY
jgi:hypothetical protein